MMAHTLFCILHPFLLLHCTPFTACVNRGCVPSKALLAASGRVRDMQNDQHLKDLGIQVEGSVNFDREGIAAHARNLASRVKSNLEGSLVGLDVKVIEGRGILTSEPHQVKDGKTGKVYTAKVSTSQPARRPAVRTTTCECRARFVWQ